MEIINELFKGLIALIELLIVAVIAFFEFEWWYLSWIFPALGNIIRINNVLGLSTVLLVFVVIPVGVIVFVWKNDRLVMEPFVILIIYVLTIILLPWIIVGGASLCISTALKSLIPSIPSGLVAIIAWLLFVGFLYFLAIAGSGSQITMNLINLVDPCLAIGENHQCIMGQ